MKIRIKGNSIRLRLSKSDVLQLGESGAVRETTSFGKSMFVYELKTSATIQKLSAEYLENTISVLVAERFAKEWYDNNIVGIDEKQPTGEGALLSILVEKDFQCLDETSEDQSDNYINPNTTCD